MEPIIIVDLQKAFSVPPKLIKGIETYSRRFDKRIFTRFENPAGSIFRTRLKQRCCAPGSTDTELLITPEKGDLVWVKNGYGLPAAAVRKLKAMRVKRATVVGIDTDACVLGVLFSLFDAGIECRANLDFCWSSSGLHKPAVKIIEEQFPPPKGSR